MEIIRKQEIKKTQKEFEEHLAKCAQTDSKTFFKHTKSRCDRELMRPHSAKIMKEYSGMIRL